MRKSFMRGRSFTSLFYQEVPEFNEEVLNEGLASPIFFYQEVPEFNEEILHEGEELHLPFFISKYLSSIKKSSMRGGASPLFFIRKYLSSMRKSSMRGRSFTSLFLSGST
jgi:hypothetical protein